MTRRIEGTSEEMTATATAAARWVVRPRLSALLDAKPWARLALVSAPAGFGKSTAVAAWAASPGVHASTVLLDRADTDVIRFVRAVTRALAPSMGASEPAARTDGDDEASVGAVLECLRLAAEAAPNERTALVLDDYHLIDEARIHRLVAQVSTGCRSGASSSSRPARTRRSHSRACVPATSSSRSVPRICASRPTRLPSCCGRRAWSSAMPS